MSNTENTGPKKEGNSSAWLGLVEQIRTHLSPRLHEIFQIQSSGPETEDELQAKMDALSEVIIHLDAVANNTAQGENSVAQGLLEAVKIESTTKVSISQKARAINVVLKETLIKLQEGA